MNSTRVNNTEVPPPFEIEVSNIGSRPGNDDESVLMPPPTQLPSSSTNATSGEDETSTLIKNSEGPLRCACGKICIRKEGLIQHQKVCKNSNIALDLTTSVTFKCQHCETHCANNSALMKHKGSPRCQQRQMQRSKSVSLTLALSGNQTESSVESIETQCKYCKRIFKSKQGLRTGITF